MHVVSYVLSCILYSHAVVAVQLLASDLHHLEVDSGVLLLYLVCAVLYQV